MGALPTALYVLLILQQPCAPMFPTEPKKYEQKKIMTHMQILQGTAGASIEKKPNLLVDHQVLACYQAVPQCVDQLHSHRILRSLILLLYQPLQDTASEGLGPTS